MIGIPLAGESILAPNTGHSTLPFAAGSVALWNPDFQAGTHRPASLRLLERQVFVVPGVSSGDFLPGLGGYHCSRSHDLGGAPGRDFTSWLECRR